MRWRFWGGCRAPQIRTSAAIISACHPKSASRFASHAFLLHMIKPAWCIPVWIVVQWFHFAIRLSRVSPKTALLKPFDSVTGEVLRWCLATLSHLTCDQKVMVVYMIHCGSLGGGGAYLKCPGVRLWRDPDRSNKLVAKEPSRVSLCSTPKQLNAAGCDCEQFTPRSALRWEHWQTWVRAALVKAHSGCFLGTLFSIFDVNHTESPSNPPKPNVSSCPLKHLLLRSHQADRWRMKGNRTSIIKIAGLICFGL